MSLKCWFQLMRGPQGYGYNVHFYNELSTDRGPMIQFVKPVVLELTEPQPDTAFALSADVPPTIFIPRRDMETLVQSIQHEQELMGRKLVGADQIRAALDATKFHLEDMRKLVFKSRGLEK